MWSGHDLVNWAGLTVLVSWKILKDSQDFLYIFSMALHHKLGVKLGLTFALQLSLLIFDCIGGAHLNATELSLRLHSIGALKCSFQFAEPSYEGIMFFQWISKGTFSKKSNKFENGFVEKAGEIKKSFDAKKKVGRLWVSVITLAFFISKFASWYTQWVNIFFESALMLWECWLSTYIIQNWFLIKFVQLIHANILAGPSRQRRFGPCLDFGFQ